jgi:hypothetical protein
MTEATEARAFEAVSKHARFADLVALARGVALRAEKKRALTWSPLAESAPEAERSGLKGEDAATDFGNAWTALERGPKSQDERALLRALWAHVVSETQATSAEEEDELATRVIWLAAFTPFDATLLLDRALGEKADDFWPALGERLRRLDTGDVEAVGRSEAIAAAIALRASSSPVAAKERARLATSVTDPAVKSLLENRDDDGESTTLLHGELDVSPRHPALTVLLAVTGILFVLAVLRLSARLALAYRRPAEVTLTASSVRVHWRSIILGRVVRERDVLLARAGLARAAREVRYARAAFYAGLLSLAVGSLIGVRTFVDGVRAASPSLLFYGLLIVALGVGLDFVLGSLRSGPKGKCRVAFVNRDGTSLSIRDVDAGDADRALAQLSHAAK